MPNEKLLIFFLNTLDEQLRANQPPFVRSQLARLEAAGYATADAKTMMAGVIAHQMADSIAEDAPFDQQQYELLLNQLPKLPGI